MFTSFKITAEEVAPMLQAMRAGFAASGRAGTFEDNAVRVIRARLAASPLSYLEFGPYWWAVKQALNEAGAALGNAGEPMVAAEYRGASLAETLVMGEAFKDTYRASYFTGTRAFDLGDGEQYELTDPDMEQRAPARR